MQHDFLMAEKLCKFLCDNKYTSIRYERTSDEFQNMVLLRACLLHSRGNKQLMEDHPLIYKKMKAYIDSINLKYFVKNFADRKRFDI